MNYREALYKSRLKRIFGFILGLCALTSLAISLLKFLFFRLDDGTQLGTLIASPVKRIIYWSYEHTPFLNVFWEYSPIPDHLNLTNIYNFYFLLTYLTIFIAMALKASGEKLAIRLGKIREQIEDQMIKESMKGVSKRTKQEIEESIIITNSSIFSQFQQLYIAPIITAVVAGVFLKVVGL